MYMLSRSHDGSTSNADMLDWFRVVSRVLRSRFADDSRPRPLRRIVLVVESRHRVRTQVVSTEQKRLVRLLQSVIVAWSGG
jgi:hypothetical protein